MDHSGGSASVSASASASSTSSSSSSSFLNNPPKSLLSNLSEYPSNGNANGVLEEPGGQPQFMARDPTEQPVGGEEEEEGKDKEGSALTVTGDTLVLGANTELIMMETGTAHPPSQLQQQQQQQQQHHHHHPQPPNVCSSSGSCSSALSSSTLASTSASSSLMATAWSGGGVVVGLNDTKPQVRVKIVEHPPRPKANSSGTATTTSSSSNNIAGGGGGVVKAPSRQRRSLQDCVMSELNGIAPLQLGAWIHPNAKEGFTVSLDSPTSGMIRRGEDALTYLNKDQFYGMHLEYTPSQKFPLTSEVVTSVIALQFREKKDPAEAEQQWDFWYMRQQSPMNNPGKLRLLDCDPKMCTGLLSPPEELAHNAILVRWNPLSESPAFVNVAIRCLSTDFTSQKGVKGIPLHIQVDTYEGNQPTGIYDRAFLQIKTFCDKGAERKCREEEKRMMQRQQGSALYAPGGGGGASSSTSEGTSSANSAGTTNPSSGNIHHPGGAQSKSLFQRAFDLVTEMILYSPKNNLLQQQQQYQHQMQLQQQQLLENGLTGGVNGAQSQLALESSALGAATASGTAAATSTGLATNVKRETLPHYANKHMMTGGLPQYRQMYNNNMYERVLLYAKQENEDVFTPLHVVPPTVQGLIRAVSAKYQIDSVDIRYLFKCNSKGIVVRIDDDMIKYYSNGDVFIMKVLATEETNSGQVFYDIVFTESPSNNVSTAGNNLLQLEHHHGTSDALAVSSSALMASSNTPVATIASSIGGGAPHQQQEGQLDQQQQQQQHDTNGNSSQGTRFMTTTHILTTTATNNQES